MTGAGQGGTGNDNTTGQTGEGTNELLTLAPSGNPSSGPTNTPNEAPTPEPTIEHIAEESTAITPLIETRPCVPFEGTAIQSDHPNTDQTCLANKCSNGCCRNYWWTICDTTNAVSSIPHPSPICSGHHASLMNNILCNSCITFCAVLFCALHLQ